MIIGTHPATESLPQREAVMLRLFSEAEDRRFSRMVLRYNALEEGSGERDALEQQIWERTKVLLYMIPQRNLYLSAEDSSSFFMYMLDDVDRIIRDFRATGLSFNGYLTQICRYRCRGYMKLKASRELTERALIYSDMTIYDSHVAERTVEYRSERCRGLEITNLRVLFERIVAADGPEIAATGPERKLQEILHDKVSRRRFLTLLLTLPDTETPGFISGVARVMSVDRGLIHRFYTLRHDELEVSHEERAKAEDVAGRYWKALMLLRHAIAKETDMEKIEDLEKAYRRTKGIYARRRMIAAKSRKGMSQKAVSKLLNKPRSTISNDICCMRQLLKSIEPMVKI